MSDSVVSPEFSSYDDFLDFAMSSGWGDGLPLVPPEPERVEEALATLTLDPGETVGEASRKGLRVTARDVALYAVLAGCRPEYLPAVVASVQAFFDDIESRDQDIGGLTETAQCVILNGPVRNVLKVNCGLGALGPGWRANATIGRALRLLVGAVFGARQSRWFGDPALYSFCFGEDEENSPWTPLHVERGFAPSSSTATVHSVNLYPKNLDRRNARPEVICDEMVTFIRGKVGGADWLPGRQCSLVLVLGDEYHRRLGAAGWTKAGIRDYLYPRLCADAGTPFYPVRLSRPEDVVLVAAGGLAYSSFFNLVSFSGFPSTRAIDPLSRSKYA